MNAVITSVGGRVPPGRKTQGRLPQDLISLPEFPVLPLQLLEALTFSFPGLSFRNQLLLSMTNPFTQRFCCAAQLFSYSTDRSPLRLVLRTLLRNQPYSPLPELR